MNDTNTHRATARKSPPLRGRFTAPGDKSISHRALILASQALGQTRIHGLLIGEDVMHTAAALRQLGVPIQQEGDVWIVDGVGIGGIRAAQAPLDMGNAGTAARLMMGLLASYPFESQFIGDASLSKRPMKRVMAPLGEMGARFDATDGDKLPLTMHGNAALRPIEYRLPVASAQVKSCIMLAALNTEGTTTIIEPEASRDHTERMLGFFGITLLSERHGDAVHWKLTGRPAQASAPRTIEVPADPSSAAFPVVAALLVPGSDITLTHVCLNPLRTGLFSTLMEMGGYIEITNRREVGGEAVGDIRVRHSALHGTTVPADRAPSMIDEYPILAVAAACANGRTTMHGLAELRVKESNRLSAIIDGMHACGVEAIEEGDSLIIHGRGRPPKGGSTIATHHDHRIAMSFLTLGLVAESPISIDDSRAIATSFPNFMALMRAAGADITSAHSPSVQENIVIAVDGPAASGKGTLARRLADYFGIAYLDTGSLYRAVGMRLIYAGKDPEDVPAAIAAARAIQDHDLNNPKLRSERIANAASKVSAIPEVREALLEYQRNFAKRPGGAVLDGRDIGTVICPDADYKFFITASIDARTRRRHKQLSETGVEVDYDSVKNDLLERDARDARRAVAPLKPANNAHEIDTTNHSANDVFAMVIDMMTKKAPKMAD